MIREITGRVIELKRMRWAEHVASSGGEERYIECFGGVS
jgi:hypothetical protein